MSAALRSPLTSPWLTAAAAPPPLFAVPPFRHPCQHTMEAFPPSLDLRGTILVLPVVAVGNVGQLAADLLVNTLRLPRSGRLADDALLPAVGGAAYPHAPGLASALEVYRAPGDGVAVAQQRSAAAPGMQVPYARRLAAFLKAAGVEQVGREGHAGGRGAVGPCSVA